MLMCADCKSNNIVETDDWMGYFREGDYIRLRRITIHRNMNDDSLKGYISMCPEYSIIVNAIGNTKHESIQKLGEMLEKVCHVKLLGKYLEEE